MKFISYTINTRWYSFYDLGPSRVEMFKKCKLLEQILYTVSLCEELMGTLMLRIGPTNQLFTEMIKDNLEISNARYR